MPNAAPTAPRWRFDNFEFRLEGRELLENCKPVHIGDQSLQLLQILLTRAGQVVTREQLRAELWPDGTHVSFDIGLNSAVRRLRRALHDDTKPPRYIATLPSQGYRFIAVVERLPPAAALSVPAPAPGRRGRAPLAGWRRRPVGAGVAVGIAVLAVWAAFRPLPPPRLKRIRTLTEGARLDIVTRPASDGSRLFYSQRIGDHWELIQTAGDGAIVQPVPMPFPNPRLLDVSPDGSAWLLGSLTRRDEPLALWYERVPGGAPSRLAGIQAWDAVWFPDGQRILYATSTALWSIRADGSDQRALAPLQGATSWLSWSPDGRRLRFTRNDASGASLWEWRPDSAQPPQRLNSPVQICCGAWTPDGRYFLYSARQNESWNLWAQREPTWLRPWWHPSPVQLTAEPESAMGAFTGWGNSNQVVFYQQQLREEPQRLDLRTHQFQPLFPGHSVFQFNYSHDGRRVAYVATSDSTLWIADAGPNATISNPRRLTLPAVAASFPRWSPDDRWIAYDSQSANQPKRAYIIATDGGSPQALASEAGIGDTEVETPDWSPDGSKLALALDFHTNASTDRYLVAVASRATKHLVTLPGSEGLAAPRWSPNGRWLAAFSSDQHRLEVYDFADAHWQVVTTGAALSIPLWSGDNHYLYYQDLLAPGQPVFRLVVGSWHREQVADFSTVLHGGVNRCGFLGVAPDGSLLVSFNRGYFNLHMGDLDLP